MRKPWGLRSVTTQVRFSVRMASLTGRLMLRNALLRWGILRFAEDQANFLVSRSGHARKTHPKTEEQNWQDEGNAGRESVVTVSSRPLQISGFTAGSALHAEMRVRRYVEQARGNGLLTKPRNRQSSVMGRSLSSRSYPRRGDSEQSAIMTASVASAPRVGLRVCESRCDYEHTFEPFRRDACDKCGAHGVAGLCSKRFAGRKQVCWYTSNKEEQVSDNTATMLRDTLKSYGAREFEIVALGGIPHRGLAAIQAAVTKGAEAPIAYAIALYDNRDWNPKGELRRQAPNQHVERTCDHCGGDRFVVIADDPAKLYGETYAPCKECNAESNTTFYRVDGTRVKALPA